MTVKNENENGGRISSDKGSQSKPQRGKIPIISLLSLILSILAFATTHFPYIKLWNANYIEMANAGDVKSQIFLAEHYFEICDYDESCYWYKIAAMTDSEYKAKALNNLAYINLVYGQRENILVSYDDKALKLFYKAGLAGEITGYRNALVLLLSNPAEAFPSVINNEQLKTQIKEALVEGGGYEHDLFCSFDSEWEHPKVIQTSEPILDLETETDKYILIGSMQKLGITTYTYSHYVRKQGAMGDYSYLPVLQDSMYGMTRTNGRFKTRQLL